MDWMELTKTAAAALAASGGVSTLSFGVYQYKRQNQLRSLENFRELQKRFYRV